MSVMFLFPPEPQPMPDASPTASKHTPAPWKAERQNWRGEPDPHKFYISGDCHECFQDDVQDPDETYMVSTAVAIVDGNATSREVTAANAYLISASPDLLAYAECQDAADRYDTPGNGFTKVMLFDVLKRHGFDGHRGEFTSGEVLSFLRSIRKAAVLKATNPGA